MANRLDLLERLKLLSELRAVAGDRVGITGDELDCFVESAGRFALPHFTKAATTKRFQQDVTGQRLCTGSLRVRLRRGRGTSLKHGRCRQLWEKRFLPL